MIIDWTKLVFLCDKSWVYHVSVVGNSIHQLFVTKRYFKQHIVKNKDKMISNVTSLLFNDSSSEDISTTIFTWDAFDVDGNGKSLSNKVK